MTGRDLVAARGKLVGTGRGAVKLMANKLETPYSTYQKWEARPGLIPCIAAVAVSALLALAEIEFEEAELALDDAGVSGEILQ